MHTGSRSDGMHAENVVYTKWLYHVAALGKCLALAGKSFFNDAACTHFPGGSQRAEWVSRMLFFFSITHFILDM